MLHSSFYLYELEISQKLESIIGAFFKLRL